MTELTCLQVYPLHLSSVMYDIFHEVNSNASDVDVKPKLSEAHMIEAEVSMISQEEAEVQEAASGKSTPMVSSAESYNEV